MQCIDYELCFYISVLFSLALFFTVICLNDHRIERKKNTVHERTNKIWKMNQAKEMNED